VKFVILLDENVAVKNVTFVASDLRKVPQVDPSSVDLCFLMETVDDLRRKVESLLDVKQQLSAVQNMVSGLSAKVNGGLNARQNNQEQAYRPSTQPVGMAKDTNLKVNFPSAASSGSSSQPILASSNASGSGSGNGSYAQAARKAPMVGSKVIPNASLKASSKPREHHVHVGNLDMGTTPESIKMFFEEQKIPIRLLDCEIIHSRHPKPRCLSAHITIDARDKDNAYIANNWPGDTTVRPWRHHRGYRSSQRDDYTSNYASSRDWSDY
jgi:hypothetical protein